MEFIFTYFILLPIAVIIFIVAGLILSLVVWVIYMIYQEMKEKEE